MTPADRLACDVLVVGAGAAGLCAAMAARRAGARVLVASVTSPHTGSATAITQVAGAFLAAAAGVADPNDSPQTHFEDTVEAGRGLSDRPLVWHRVNRIVPLLKTLEGHGVAFATTNEGRWLQFHSPGHRYPRTLAFGPSKGISLARALADAAAGAGAQFASGLSIVHLLVRDGAARGALGWDQARRQPVVVTAGATVLATGGAGLCYPRTGLPRATAGSGFALALEAGCSLLDMEFIQWYPTALAEEGAPAHLVHYDTLLRHGAVFRAADGSDLLTGHGRDERRGITRDEMARLIARALMRGALPDRRVFVDLSTCLSLDEHPVLRASPYVPLLRERAGRAGAGLWVSPAAHYYMGGVQISAGGETEVPGLFAAGEVTGGVFGANRLEGNGLTDCVAGGDEAGYRAAALAQKAPAPPVDEGAWRGLADDLTALHARRTGLAIADAIEELQTAMEAGAGLVRSAEGLRIALARIQELEGNVDRLAAPEGQDQLQLATFPQVLRTAEAIVLASLAREESRGAFIHADFPTEAAGGDDAHVSVVLRAGRLEAGRRPVIKDLPVT